MRYEPLKVVSICLSSLLVACAPMSLQSNSGTTLATLDDVTTGSIQTRPSVVAQDGQIAILHATKEGRVALQQGKTRQLLDQTARVQQGANYFQLLQPEKNTLEALWWSHQNGKNGYFTVSSDAGKTFSPVAMVNSEHQILPPITVAHGPSGTVGIAYHDERLPGFQTYFNRSVDGGRTWAKDDVRLDTPSPGGRSSFVTEPQLVQTDGAWVVAWVDSIAATDGAFRIISRRSTDQGVTWSDPTTLFSAPRHISALVVRAQGKRVAIVADELERGLIGVVSQDEGLHWKTTDTLVGSEKASNSGVEAAWGADRLHITWMQDRKDSKTKIYAATLDLQTAQWASNALRLDTKAHENTRSEISSVTYTGQGAVVAAWVDYRDIRPNIYMAASFDQGATWTEPKPLQQPGMVAVGWPQLQPYRDGALIAYELYPADRANEGKFVVDALSINAQEKTFGVSGWTARKTEEQRKARLEERIKALWNARISNDYETAFDMFDFAFRAVTPKQHYLNSVGVITYYSATLDKLQIEGNEAAVDMKVRYEVKPVTLPSTGKPISIEPFDTELPNTWVWVGDDWYLVYKPSFDPPMLKY